MRITFIEPAAPGFHVYSFVKQMRLGLPLLGAILKQHGHEVKVYAESLGEVDWDEVLSSDLVGVSTTTSTAVRAYRYAQRARDAGVPVVMGGPHVTFMAREALDFCDYVIRNEGEDAIVELVEFLEGKRAISDIQGLSYRNPEGEQVDNPERALLGGLTDLPWPDLSLVVGGEKIHPTPILSSRGCPFDCEFCSVVMMFGRRVRAVDPEEVVRELKRIRPTKVFFYDDNFFISKRRGRELLALMAKEKMNFPFFAQIRVDSVCKNGKVDQELLDLMWEAGCRIVYLGLESVNPETLKEYHKEASIDDIVGGLDALHKRGIHTHGMFVFGADSDTIESLSMTADFASQNGLNSVQFLALTPLPGTRQTDMLEREGRVFTHNWSLYDGHHVVFWPKQMTPYDLQIATLDAHKRFYTGRRVFTMHPNSPRYRKHQWQGYALAHSWEHVPENRAFLRELKEYSSKQRPPVPDDPFKGSKQSSALGALGPGLETPTA